MKKAGTRRIETERCYLRRLLYGKRKSGFEIRFNEIGYNNITTFVAMSNTRSQNALKRLNFTCEATLRQRDKTAFGIEDCYSYSLLKDEFV